MRLLPLSLLASLVFSHEILAADNACLLEGEMNMMGQHIVIKDCLQNNGVDAAQFKEVCSNIGGMNAAMGMPPAKITYLAACPKQAQASCEGFFGQPMTSYYYKRDAEMLATSKQGCEMQGGKWK
jgi:hypothetical protein